MECCFEIFGYNFVLSQYKVQTMPHSIKILFIVSILSTSLLAIYDLKPISVTKDLTCFIGDFNPPTKSNKGFVSNVCFVDIGESVVVIEAGPTYLFAKQLHALIAKTLGKKVSHVIVTNFHDDRYTGASFYKEQNIPIIAHKSIVKELQEHPDKFKRIAKVTTKLEYAKSKVVQPDILVDKSYTIKGSQKTIDIMKLGKSSNALSDIIVHISQDDFVFVGNLVFNGRMINYAPSSSMQGWIEALEKLSKMNVKYILGGHGSEYDKNSYKPTLQYLQILQESVQKAYDDEVEREDISKYVNDKKFDYYNHYQPLSKINAKVYYDQLEWE